MATYIVVGGAQQGAIGCHSDTGHAHILLRNQLVAAIVLGEIPDLDTAGAVAADDLALVGVDDDIVGGAAVIVAALDGAGARLPDLDGAVLGAGHHPLTLAVEGDAGDVARVALEGQQRVGVGALDVEQLDGVVAGGREEALVGRDAQAVDLGVWVLNGARADAGESLPEPVMRQRSASAHLGPMTTAKGNDKEYRDWKKAAYRMV